MVWKEGLKPAFLHPVVWESDLHCLDSCVKEKRRGAQTNRAERAAWGRLLAARVLFREAPALLWGEGQGDTRGSFCTQWNTLESRRENTLAALGAPQPIEASNCSGDDFSSPPPRMPFLLCTDAMPHGVVPSDSLLSSFFCFLEQWPHTAGGRSILESLGVAGAQFEAAARAASVAVVEGMNRNACYVFEELTPSPLFLSLPRFSEHVDAFFLADLGASAPDVRTRSLWAHEAAHLAHGIALRAQKRSPLLTSDEEKEAVALEAELLSLCDLSREGLAAAIARGTPRVLSNVALWWQGAHEAGGPYIPAAWRVWRRAQNNLD